MRRSAREELIARIERSGSVRFDELVELALYAPDRGFFAVGGGAGRSGGDFLTSPEVGPLFGAVVAGWLDRRWVELGRPDPYVVVEAGAGRGALAISLLAAAPECSEALRYVLVERSEGLRRRQGEHLPLVHPFEVLGPAADDDLDRRAVGGGGGPLVCSLEELPSQSIVGVVLANELLDNLPFRLVQRGEAGWSEVRVTADDDGRLVELLVPADSATAERAGSLAPDASLGARLPVQERGAEWLVRAFELVERGSVLVLDYGRSTAQLAARPMDDWVRTYRAHGRGGDPLDAVGEQDLTCEVAFDQLGRVASPTGEWSQAEWLREQGIDDLVEEGRRIWVVQASAPNLDAMRARSRVAEAEALTDPGGLGAFRVVEWRRGSTPQS